MLPLSSGLKTSETLIFCHKTRGVETQKASNWRILTFTEEESDSLKREYVISKAYFKIFVRKSHHSSVDIATRLWARR
jgi:hypothetical protein